MPVLACTLEAAGLSTILVTMMPSWAELVGAPRTLAVEFPFGYSGHPASPLTLTTPRGRRVLLRGKIDRVDVADLSDELLGMVIDYKTRLIERACDLGADIIVTGDDYCNRTGPMMSVAHFERFVLPYLKATVDVSHRKGVPHIKHTDGNIWPIFDLMVGAGIDAIDPLEPVAGMDIGEVKERYGDRLCLMGNIDCGDLLSRGTPEQVASAVKTTIARAAKGGGYVLASSNSIHPAVKPENYATMVMAGRHYGLYPL